MMRMMMMTMTRITRMMMMTMTRTMTRTTMMMMTRTMERTMMMMIMTMMMMMMTRTMDRTMMMTIMMMMVVGGGGGPFRVKNQVLLQNRKIAPCNCSPKLLFKIITEKPRPKETPKKRKLQGYFPKEAISKLVRKPVQSCSPKLFPKGNLQSCCPKAAILQTSQNCAPKLLPKAALRSCL